MVTGRRGLLSRLPVLDRKLLRELWGIRGQALAIAAVIGAGVALYVLMLSSLHSLELTRETYYQRYRFADVFASLKRAPLRLEEDLRQIPGVAEVRTRVVAGVSLDIEGLLEPASGRLVSVPEAGPPDLCGLHLREGRYLLPERPDEVVVNARFAAANGFGPGDELGAILNGRQQQLRIVGIASSPEYVYNLRPGELLADDRRSGVLWLGRRALGAAFDMEGGFNDVILTLEPGASEPEVIAEVDRLLAPYGGLGAVARRLQSSHWILENELTQLRTMGAAVPLIFLGVAAFLLHVVLSRIVAVQREEIAAIKAVGYSNRALAVHYVKWSLAIALAGGALGLAAGAALGHGMTSLYATYFDFPFLTYALPWGVVVWALAIAVVAAVLGALSAVRKAVSLPPAEAMRPEPPAVYRISLAERLGLKRFLSQPTRIILRNLERNGGRSLISLFGIAAGGALLIVGSFSLDAVDLMKSLQFDLAQRYDVLVTLVEPTSAGVLDDFASLPGVREVEAFRAVPVELRHGHRQRQTGLTGLPREARLNRLVDSAGRVISPPEGGLILSTTLAQILDVEPGGTVTVQVLEGRRELLQLPVARVVDDLMGTNAYLEAGALHRLMEEGETVSGAYLAVDPTRSAELYRRLKATPRVAGVLRQNAARESLDETMAETVGTVRAFNVAFALIIAFGVVYNSARITLAERSRELATLRVIGFHRSEISYILLGEIAVLTLAAVPTGMLLGYGLAAATAGAMNTEVYRIPLVVSPRTFAFAAITILLATAVSSLVVRRRLDRLDLVAVLKTRE